MRAARCLAYGEPEQVVVVEDLPAPSPGAGEVLVDVAAASVNYPDVLLVRNEYQVSIAPPFTPGSDFAGTLGADGVIDYARESLKDRAKALSGGGVDVVIDPVGGPYAEAALRAMAVGGRFVVIGFASKEIPRIPLNLVLLKGVQIRAYDAAKTWQHHPEETRRRRDELLALLAAGRIRPLVSDVFPLEGAAAALRAVFDRRAIGKVVGEPARQAP